MIGTIDLMSFFNPFGIKTTHVYLAVAEVEIQLGEIDEAMTFVDKVRINRITPDGKMGRIFTGMSDELVDYADAILLVPTILSPKVHTLWCLCQFSLRGRRRTSSWCRGGGGPSGRGRESTHRVNGGL